MDNNLQKVIEREEQIVSATYARLGLQTEREYNILQQAIHDASSRWESERRTSSR